MESETILALLAEVAPAEIVDAVIGVAPETIAAVEGALGIAFPSTYRAFLEAMGEHTGGFAAAGRTRSTRMSELLAVVPGPDERTPRYWRFAIERNLRQPLALDHYLDLPTNDSIDVDIVAFDEEPRTADDAGAPVGLTFYENLRERMFNQFCLPPSATSASVHVSGVTPQIRAQHRQSLVDALTAEGFAPFAPAPGRLDLFRRDADAAAVRTFDDAGSVAVFADVCEPDRCVLLVEKLRDRLPDDAQVRWRHR